VDATDRFERKILPGAMSQAPCWRRKTQQRIEDIFLAKGQKRNVNRRKEGRPEHGEKKKTRHYALALGIDLFEKFYFEQ